MSGESELVAFLRFRLVEDETADDTKRDSCEWVACGDINRQVNLYHVSVEARLRIVDLHARDHECSVYGPTRDDDIDNCAWVTGDDCSTLRLLALPYANHPHYRPEWSPLNQVHRDD